MNKQINPEKGKDDYIEEQLKRKNVDLYITLIRTFGLISISIPAFLLLVNEFTLDISLISLIATGIILIIISECWNYKNKKSKKGSIFI